MPKNLNKQNKNKTLYLYLFFFYFIIPISHSIQITKNERILQETVESFEYCDIMSIFNQSISCKINTDTIDQEILEGLKNYTYREFLINNFLQNNGNSSRTEGDDTYYIIINRNENSIKLGSCEEHVRNKYCISEAADLYLYIHKYQNPQFKIPILGMEVFILSTTFNGQTIVSPISIDVCINYNIPINYVSSVDINEEEIINIILLVIIIMMIL